MKMWYPRFLDVLGGSLGFWPSDHGPVWTLHLKELDDEGGPPGHDLGGQVAERTVLDAHDGQLAAQRQLEGQAVQVGVVVQVQLLQVLQGACRGRHSRVTTKGSISPNVGNVVEL